MNYGVLLAGGKGTRLGLSIPKQFLKLGEKTILQHTVEKFISCSELTYTVVVVPQAWLEQSSQILHLIQSPNVGICIGGESRQESLYKGLIWLNNKFNTSDSDIVVSHDVARPFVTLNMIKENIKVCQTYGAADTVIPASDTIVESENGDTVNVVPIRKHMFLGQTPQTFYINQFIRIFEQLDQDYLNNVTDAAKILNDSGVVVGLVRGDISNIKITTLFDLKVAGAILEK